MGAFQMHVHIVSGDGEAKFWLTPKIELAKNYHFLPKQLKVIESLIKEHLDELSSRLRMQLTALDTAQEIDDMDIPGFKLHPLKGKLKGRWSISVSGNWRITFEFREGNAFVLDYEDYH